MQRKDKGKKIMEVLKKTKQMKEIPSEWKWTEPAVWTERMLYTLEQGVKGGKWFSLIDKIYRIENLKSAFSSVKKNKGSAGVDNVSLKKYEANLEHNLEKLSEELRTEEYKPKAVKRIYITKSGGKGKRPLGIPTVRDRIVQKAVCNVIEPIFENEFHNNSYGFRPCRGCKDALREVDMTLKSGRMYVVDADIKGFFDNISHEKLMKKVGEHISDSRVLNLIRLFLENKVCEEKNFWMSEKGTPQGGVLSPLLANIYMNDLDWRLSGKDFKMVRYADDFVILCDNEDEAVTALKEVKAWSEEHLLELHPEKTKLVNMEEAGKYFDFLGYRFKRTVNKGKLIKVPCAKSVKNLRGKVRKYTKRCNKHSMEKIIEIINPILRGWYEYYKHSHKFTFGGIDSWVRMRLRSILRKRNKRKGRGRGKDHYRYRNSFFQELGLFTLEQVRITEVQSLRSETLTGEPCAGEPHARFGGRGIQ